MAKPKKLTEQLYKQWAIENIGTDFDSDQIQKSYRTNVNSVHQSASSHIFFRDLGKRLIEWEAQYNGGKKYSLFMIDTNEEKLPEVRLKKKPYNSMVNKSYRYNYVSNPLFDKNPNYVWSPIKGWLTPNNWFQVINDTVRTMIVCKFVDGPEFLSKKLGDWAEKCGLSQEGSSRQKEEGYYAYHFYVRVPAIIFESGSFIDRDVNVEIQIATQLQEAMYQITHHEYEKMRIKNFSDSESWKWDFGSPKFRISYMSHTLHLLEAFILDLRDKVTL